MKKIIFLLMALAFFTSNAKAQCPDSLFRMKKIIEILFIDKTDDEKITDQRYYFIDKKIDSDSTRGLLYVFTDTFTFSLLPRIRNLQYGGRYFDEQILCQKGKENKRDGACYAKLYYRELCSDKKPILVIVTGEVFVKDDECTDYPWGGDYIYFNKDFTISCVEGWAY